MRVSPSRSRRRRVGRVTVCQRGRRFWVYYRQGGEVIRRAVGLDRTEALSVAAHINAELAEGLPRLNVFSNQGVPNRIRLELCPSRAMQYKTPFFGGA